MAVRSRSQFNTLYAAISGLFADNVTRDISEGDMRTMLTDLKDSVLFVSDDSLVGVQSVDVSSNFTLTLSKEGLRFAGSSSIGGTRTWSFSLTGGVTNFTFLFELSGIYVQTLPSSVIMNDIRWDNSAKTWTPTDAGKYKAVANFDGTNWYLEISQSPFI